MAESSIWYDWENVERVSARSYESPRVPKSDLDKDAFLKLLITQLQYQDPLNPTDDKEFVAQMAQFTALEQMQNMNQRMSQTQAFAMIGKEVYALKYNKDTYSTEEITGIVTAVQVIKGQTYVILDDETQVSIDDVQLVYNDGYVNSIINLNKNVATSQSMSLIGRIVQGVLTDKNGKALELIEGMVDTVKFDSTGRPWIVIGTDEVDAGNVISVADELRLIGKLIGVSSKNSNGEWVESDDSFRIDRIIFTQEKYYELVNGKQEEKTTEKVYAVVGGVQYELKKIDLLTDAQAYVGKDIHYSGINGEVDRVVLREGLPYLQVGDKLVSYAEFRGITLAD